MGNKQSVSLPKATAANLRQSVKSIKVSSVDSSPTSRRGNDSPEAGLNSRVPSQGKNPLAVTKSPSDAGVDAHVNKKKKKKVIKKKRSPGEASHGLAAAASATTAATTATPPPSSQDSKTRALAAGHLAESSVKRRISRRALHTLPATPASSLDNRQNSSRAPTAELRPAGGGDGQGSKPNSPSLVVWPRTGSTTQAQAQTESLANHRLLVKAPAALVQISPTDTTLVSSSSPGDADKNGTAATDADGLLTASKAARRTRRRSMILARGETDADGAGGARKGPSDEADVSIVLDKSVRRRTSSTVRKKVKRRVSSVTDEDKESATNRTDAGGEHGAAGEENENEMSQSGGVVGQSMIGIRGRLKSRKISRKYSIFSIHNALRNISDEDEGENKNDEAGEGADKGAAQKTMTHHHHGTGNHVSTDTDTSTGLKRMNDLDPSEWKSAARRLSHDSDVADALQAHKDGKSKRAEANNTTTTRRKSMKKKSSTRRGSKRGSRDAGEMDSVTKAHPYSFVWRTMLSSRVSSPNSSIVAAAEETNSNNNTTSERGPHSTTVRRRVKSSSSGVARRKKTAAAEEVSSLYGMPPDASTHSCPGEDASAATKPAVKNERSRSRFWQGSSFFMNDVLSRSDSHSNHSNDSNEASTLKKGFSMFASAARSFMSRAKSVRHNRTSHTSKDDEDEDDNHSDAATVGKRGGDDGGAAEESRHNDYSIGGGPSILSDSFATSSTHAPLISRVASPHKIAANKTDADESPGMYSIGGICSVTSTPASEAMTQHKEHKNANTATAADAASATTMPHTATPGMPQPPFPMDQQQQQQYYYQRKQKEYMMQMQMQMQNTYRPGNGHAMVAPMQGGVVGPHGVGASANRSPQAAAYPHPGLFGNAVANGGNAGGAAHASPHTHHHNHHAHAINPAMAGMAPNNAEAIAVQEAYCKAHGYKGKIPQPQPFLEGPRLRYKPRIDYAKVFNYSMDQEPVVDSPLKAPNKPKGFFATMFSS